MQVNVQVNVNAPKHDVWQLVTDIANSADRISGINDVEILDSPAEGILGLKWKETRTMMGKTAEETMWITDVVEDDYYVTEARSHGSIYQSRIYVSGDGETTLLGMDFNARPESKSFMAKLMSATVGFMFKGMTRKCLQQDLEDIKAAAEGGRTEAQPVPTH